MGMGMGMGGTFDSVKQQYKTLQRSGDASGAIDVILRDMTKELTADMDALEKAWEDAVDMAMASVQSRAKEVVFTVASRLVDIGRCALELSAPSHLCPYPAASPSIACLSRNPLCMALYIQSPSNTYLLLPVTRAWFRSRIRTRRLAIVSQR